MMAWDRRKPSRRRASSVPAVETSSSSPQPLACSSLSSSEKFRSLYDKMLEGSIESENKNLEPLVCTRCLQPAPEQPPGLHPVHKYGSKIVFPHVITRGSVVGKKVYCSSSINTNITWQQKNSSQRVNRSMTFLDFNQQKSSITLASVRRTEILPALPQTPLKEHHPVDKGQCRCLLLGLAGAAGMRLICPPLQLPLLEILLFSHQQLSTKNKALVQKEGGLWRFPLYMALATLRPFCGSLVRRCLTAVLFFSQMRSKQNLFNQSLKCIPELYSVLVFENGNLDRQEFTISSKRIQVGDRGRTTGAVDVSGNASGNSDTIFSADCEPCTGASLSACVPDKDVPIIQQKDSPLKIQVPVEQSVGYACQLADNNDVSIADLESEECTLVPATPKCSEAGDDVVSAVASENCLQSHNRARAIDDVVGSCKRLQIHPEIMTRPCVRTNPCPSSSPVVAEDLEMIAEGKMLSPTDAGFEEQGDSKIACCVVEAFLERGEPMQTVHGSQAVVELTVESDLPSEKSSDVALMEPSFRDDSVIVVEGGKVTSAMVTLPTVGNELCWLPEEIPDISVAEPLEDRKCGDSVERAPELGNEACTSREHRHDMDVSESLPAEGLIETQSEPSFSGRVIAGDELERRSSDRLREQERDVRGVSSIAQGAGFLHSLQNNYISKENDLDYSLEESSGESSGRDDICFRHSSIPVVESSRLDHISNEIYPAYSSGEISSGATSKSSLTSRQVCTNETQGTIEIQGQLLKEAIVGEVNLVQEDTSVAELPVVNSVLDDRINDARLSEYSSEITAELSEDSRKGGFGNEADDVDEAFCVPTEIAAGELETTSEVDEREPDDAPLLAYENGTSEKNHCSSRNCTISSTEELNQATTFPCGIDTSEDGDRNLERCAISISSEASLCRERPEDDIPKHPFVDHRACLESRERRHSHGDQTYINMQELLPAPWGQLIFWHGRCKEGRPTLCVLLGKAVRQLPSQELKRFIAVTVSHLEYAELNFFKDAVKQMNIVMDLEGLGFMRLPPMNILSSIGAVLNRDYAGRGGWIMLVNAPVMLGFVISAIQGVIMRKKDGAVDNGFKGFLEGKDRIMIMGSKYRPILQKYFDTSMLPLALGGDCVCTSNAVPCDLGNDFLKLG